MIIPVHYTYRSYPFSTRATNLSRALAICTTWAAILVYALFWLMIVCGLLTALGLGDNPAMILSLISLTGLFFLIRKIKKTLTSKIERIALADLEKLIRADSE